MIKKIIAYVPMRIFFYLGHWISIPIHKYDLGRLYLVYNTLMGWSFRLNEWAGFDYWTKEED